MSQFDWCYSECHKHTNLLINNNPQTKGIDCLLILTFATNTNFVVFGLTRPGLEPTIYRTRVEDANYYATDAVVKG
jgi:hypothetical protein